MTQSLTAVDPSVPGGDTGTSLAGKLNDWRDSILSSHSGSSRPSYAAAGTLWRDTTTTPWILKMFDGSDDISIADIDPSTNAVTRFYAAGAGAAAVLAGVDTSLWITPAGLQTRIADIAAVRARTTGYLATAKIMADALAEVTITDAAAPDLNLNTFINAVWTMGSTGRQIKVPINGQAGWGGVIRMIQGSGGSKVPTFATGWQFAGGAAPVFSTTAGAVDLLFYQMLDSGDVFGSLINNVKRP